jgi:hypothetical protein
VDGRDTWPQRGADAARAVYLCIVTSVGRVRDRKLGAQVERSLSPLAGYELPFAPLEPNQNFLDHAEVFSLAVGAGCVTVP